MDVLEQQVKGQRLSDKSQSKIQSQKPDQSQTATNNPSSTVPLKIKKPELNILNYNPNSFSSFFIRPTDKLFNIISNIANNENKTELQVVIHDKDKVYEKPVSIIKKDNGFLIVVPCLFSQHHYFKKMFLNLKQE